MMRKYILLCFLIFIVSGIKAQDVNHDIGLVQNSGGTSGTVHQKTKFNITFQVTQKGQYAIIFEYYYHADDDVSYRINNIILKDLPNNRQVVSPYGDDIDLWSDLFYVPYVLDPGTYTFSLDMDVNYAVQYNFTVHYEGASSSGMITRSLPSTPATNRNYILSRAYTSADGKNYLDQVQYFDGLGRPVQIVQTGITPDSKDLVAIREYDGFGRESNAWLPGKVTAANNGAFVAMETAKGYIKTSNAGDQKPYSMPVYEASPLNRVLKQFGPGQDWHNADNGNGKAVSTAYKTNISGNVTLNCKLYTAGGTNQSPALTQSGNYATGELYVTEMKDEDGNTSYEFKDKLGQAVLIRQLCDGQSYDTYYVYNDYGNKCFVLPPKIQDEGIAQARLDELAYLYKYDHRNRCIARKIPGCDWVYYVYDKADRLIFSQDGEQRIKATPEWTFTIPDAFGRVVLAGTCTNSLDYAGNPLGADIVKTSRADGTNSYKGYDAPAGVTLTAPTILSVNYYDDYAFLGYNTIPNTSDTQYTSETGYGVCYGDHQAANKHKNKGLLTGTLTARMNPDGTTSQSYLYTVMYYDNRGRIIQTKGNNHLEGGIEKEYTAYNFTGQPTQRKHIHQATGKNTQTEVYTCTYDHAGRLLTTTHQLTDGSSVKPQVTLTENTYDELGRLKTNKKNNQANLNTTYAYNIRSWTNSITNAHFNQALSYSYNGNILSMQWGQAGKTRKYNFSYDNLSRLKSAVYTGDGNFNTAYSYDKHGNMLTLQRYGLITATTYGIIDNLTMTYTGNQMKAVSDAAADIALNASMDFKDYSNAAVEYAYNKNGAMWQDLNRGISQIQYNSLNLPRIVDIKNKTTEGRNEYTYSSSGQKLRAVQRWNPDYSTTPVIGSTVNTAALTMSSTTDYAGNIIYENNALKRILVDGGYYEAGNYYFYINDHLGNNRIVADAAASVVQSTQYYPFGMPFADATGQGIQPYKYNGKELDTRNSLNMHDYSARWKADWYFPGPDPHAEKYYSWSPYSYCFNNPMRFIDKDGRDPGTPFRSKDDAAKDWGRYYNGASILRGKEMSSSLYTYQKGGKTYYTYTEANIGTNAGVSPSEPTNGEKVIGDIHSHGKFEVQYKNNEFSKQDKRDNDKNKIDGYVTTPDGSLKKYDVKTKKESVLSTDLQSDPKDPQRKNKNDPVDVPQNKENQMKRTEEELKSNYRGSHGGYNTIDP